MENRVPSDRIALSELRKEMGPFALLSAREQEKTLHALFSRFIEPDRTEYVDPGESLCVNLHAYCGNNPIAHSEPSGHMPEWCWFSGRF